MAGLFLVKPKTRKDIKTHEEVSVVSNLKKGFIYAVLDVWKWREKREDTYVLVTKFLLGDQETGLLHWVDSHGVDFVSVAPTFPEEIEETAV
jgi:hypothetical protein